MSIQQTNSNPYFDLTRASRLFIIAFPFSVLMVALVAWSDPKASSDVIATSAAVPLIVSYLMIRAIMWLASGLPELTEDEKRIFKETSAVEHRTPNVIKVEWRHQDTSGNRRTAVEITLAGLLAIAFVLGVWFVVAGTLSAGIYWGLGLAPAVSMAVSVIKWTLRIVAATAVVLCLIDLCKASLLKIAKLSHDIFDDPFSMFHGRAS